MNDIRIESSAAELLAGWKLQFTTDVREAAKQIALESDAPDLVTRNHYRQAAEIALRRLAESINYREATHAGRKAA